ncbi:MAG TPA: NADP-dependent phosphogluconate dehydrogenase [Fimbriimonadaceae bacterium]|jgi:6-phosphogluconate dehydrogenase
MIDTQVGVSEFGMVGLGTMGRNLLLNIADHGRSVSGFDLNQQQVDLLATESAGKPTMGFTDVANFVASLRKPRCITMLVPAGSPVDSVIATFKPFLEPGDLLIDSGNSYFKDTDRRIAELAPTGIAFFGMGISGGESGARYGPSMMAGGTAEDYAKVSTVLELVAAKADDGRPCVARVGNGSGGHYVKMVHNGIEYGIMQLLAETYDLMKRSWGMSNSEMADVFGAWTKSDIGGFLIEITEQVLRKKDDETGKDLVDMVKDEAKEKGTGKWTSQDAMDLRVAVPTIDAAVNARELSDLKDERVAASKLFGTVPGHGEKNVDKLREALSVGMITAYAQGMAQLRVASGEYKYDAQMEQVSAIWRAGCIIRSALLKPMMNAYVRNPDLPNLLVDPDLLAVVKARDTSLRWLVGQAAANRIPTPAYMASLAYIDGYASERLPANLTQAQRDYFGAHTYARIDKPGVFHTEWAEGS